MKLVCDYCGSLFERPAHVVLKNRGRGLTKNYCNRDCSSAAAHRMSPVSWLSAATEDDERYLVNRIIHYALEMQKVEFGSVAWERLDAAHSAMLDTAMFVFKLRGKYQAPTHEGERG